LARIGNRLPARKSIQEVDHSNDAHQLTIGDNRESAELVGAKHLGRTVSIMISFSGIDAYCSSTKSLIDLTFGRSVKNILFSQ
jgi:hypothetical protein